MRFRVRPSDALRARVDIRGKWLIFWKACIRISRSPATAVSVQYKFQSVDSSSSMNRHFLAVIHSRMTSYLRRNRGRQAVWEGQCVGRQCNG